MTRSELWELVWSTSILKASAMVGLSTAGLAKACRRNGVALPPRGWRQRVDAGQDLKRAPPPNDGDLETDVHLMATPRAVPVDATAAMLHQRLAESASDVATERAAFEAASRECAWILGLGLRRQLHAAAEAYLAGIAEAAPTFDRITADAAAEWLRSARVALAGAGPAADAADALRARAAGPSSPVAWLRLVLGAPTSAAPAASPRRDRLAARTKAPRASSG